jgi:hypothetical protein
MAQVRVESKSVVHYKQKECLNLARMAGQGVVYIPGLGVVPVPTHKVEEDTTEAETEFFGEPLPPADK